MTVGAGIYWLVFAGLQIRWWNKGCAKFWRPVYAYLLFANIVLSIITLPLLLWPRFRRWLLRMTKPVDVWKPEDAIRRLAQLRDEGFLTADEFDAKKAELLAELR